MKGSSADLGNFSGFMGYNFSQRKSLTRLERSGMLYVIRPFTMRQYGEQVDHED